MVSHEASFGNTQYVRKGNVLQLKPLPWQAKVAVVVLFAEVATMLSGAVYFAWGALSGQARLLSTLLAIIGFIVLAAIWVSSLAIGLLQHKKSSRTAALYAQMIPISIGFGSASGPGANALVAFVLIAVGLAVVLLLLSRPVGSIFNRTL